MNLLWLMQGAGVLLGILGSIVLTTPTYRAKRQAFRIWAISNLTMTLWGLITGDEWLVLFFGFNLSVTLVGLFRDRYKRGGIPA